MPHLRMSKQRKRWVKQWKPDLIAGSGLPTPASVQIRYRRHLVSLARRMKAEAVAVIKELREEELAQEEAKATTDASLSVMAREFLKRLSKRLNSLFDDRAERLAKSMVNQVEKASTVNLKSSLRELADTTSLNPNLFSKEFGDITRATIAENVSLIKSIPEQFLTRIEGDVYRAISGGSGLAGVLDSVKRYGNMSERRARLIADDQTRKAYNNINRARVQDVGITKGQWLHSGGSRDPRDSHVKMHMKTFDLEKGMWDSTVQRYVQPGELPYCRCSFRPIIEFEDGENAA